jgi:phospholipase C
MRSRFINENFMKASVLTVLFSVLALVAPTTSGAASSSAEDVSRIENIVVIYLENHSFDNLYGLFPGADGLANATRQTRLQTDLQGKPYVHLPRVMDTHKKPPEPDRRFPEKLPNRPFEIGQFVPKGERIGDPSHRFYQHQAQINGGRMDRFAAVSNVGALAMGYYDGRDLPLWDFARRYTLADRFFAGAFGGSFINHMWLICACTPHHPNPPRHNRVELGTRGELLKDGALTPDGYAVNTIYSSYSPQSPEAKHPEKILPPLTLPTIGDRLSEKGIDWAWYAAGWSDALAGKPDPSFQFHHQPFAYFKRYGDETAERAAHLKDEADFLQSIAGGSLPPVVFYKPIGTYNEHPGSTDVLTGERRVAGILSQLEKSPQWPHMVVIVTYDEHGGFWDHVPPPKGDRWGPGSRVPTLIISPFSRGGHIDHTEYETNSILKLIETRFGLAPLGPRDAGANNLIRALNLLSNRP